MKREIRTLLKNRARELAKEPEKKEMNSDITEIIEFTLASERYGIESGFVKEVYPIHDFTPLPGVPSFIYGIINVRGRIIAIVDLRKFFNLPDKGLGELNKVVLIHNKRMEFGILTDTVQGIREIFLEDILPVPPTITGIGEEYLKGITKNKIILLNGENILNDEKLFVHQIAD